LPLYPDVPGAIFNRRLLLSSTNLLIDLAPQFARLASVVRVIDVPRESGGKVLRVLMNADRDRAMGILATPHGGRGAEAQPRAPQPRLPPEEPWRWRLHMAEYLASCLHPEHFGVKAAYVFGSTQEGTAGSSSDIDLLVHFTGSREQGDQLRHWLEGWSSCLAELNYLQTGYRRNGLLDVFMINDEDIRQRTNFADKIGADIEPARPLELYKDTL
jgi:hypothetical protein